MMAIFPMGLSVRLFKVKTIIIHILAPSPYIIFRSCQAIFLHLQVVNEKIYPFIISDVRVGIRSANREKKLLRSFIFSEVGAPLFEFLFREEISKLDSLKFGHGRSSFMRSTYLKNAAKTDGSKAILSVGFPLFLSLAAKMI